jgi:hypothetical protein
MASRLSEGAQRLFHRLREAEAEAGDESDSPPAFNYVYVGKGAHVRLGARMVTQDISRVLFDELASAGLMRPLTRSPTIIQVYLPPRSERPKGRAR